MSHKSLPPLPSPPATRIEVIEDRSAKSSLTEGFLRLRRLTLRNVYADGKKSGPYHYDVVEREAIDAVVMVLYDLRVEPESDPGPRVCLRSALRPPLSQRPRYALPLPEPDASANLWELPAGLIEPEEVGMAGILACAARETWEEVGLKLPPEAFFPLGPPAFLSTGVMAEKVHFVCAHVRPEQRQAPAEDGSPVEERAEVIFVPLRQALQAAELGLLMDLKTELGLRRLQAWLLSKLGLELGPRRTSQLHEPTRSSGEDQG